MLLALWFPDIFSTINRVNGCSATTGETTNHVNTIAIAAFSQCPSPEMNTLSHLKIENTGSQCADLYWAASIMLAARKDQNPDDLDLIRKRRPKRLTRASNNKDAVIGSDTFAIELPLSSNRKA